MTISTFQQTIYDAIKRIPAGQVMTYGALARAVGCGSAQAVGQALKRNPFAPEVPCHRVVAANQEIGGYIGKTAGAQVVKKRQLLESEGIVFNTDNTIPAEQFIDRLP